MNWTLVTENARRFGVAAALHELGKRLANRVVELRVMRAVVLRPDTLNRGALACEGFTAGFADPDALRVAAADPATELEPDFVEEALAKGDRCYALWDGATLASYGWYSRLPTAISPELELHFSPDYAYMYKGYTLPAYRGQRLHAVGMGRALEALTAGPGSAAGLVSYVDSHNFASLASCERLGYRPAGTLLVLSGGGRAPRCWASPQARALGIRVEVVDPARAASPTTEHAAALAGSGLATTSGGAVA